MGPATVIRLSSIASRSFSERLPLASDGVSSSAAVASQPHDKDLSFKQFETAQRINVAPSISQTSSASTSSVADE